jgi:hypothetical protein
MNIVKICIFLLMTFNSYAMSERAFIETLIGNYQLHSGELAENSSTCPKTIAISLFEDPNDASVLVSSTDVDASDVYMVEFAYPFNTTTIVEYINLNFYRYRTIYKPNSLTLKSVYAGLLDPFWHEMATLRLNSDNRLVEVDVTINTFAGRHCFYSKK